MIGGLAGPKAIAGLLNGYGPVMVDLFQENGNRLRQSAQAEADAGPP
jgi:hypothetical protein